MSGAARIGSVFKKTAARKMRHSTVSSASNKTRQVQGYEDEDEDKHRSCGTPSARIAAQLFGILHKELGGVSSQGWWKQPQKPQRWMGTLQEYAWSNQRKRCVSLSRIDIKEWGSYNIFNYIWSYYIYYESLLISILFYYFSWSSQIAKGSTRYKGTFEPIYKGESKVPECLEKQ